MYLVAYVTYLYIYSHKHRYFLGWIKNKMWYYLLLNHNLQYSLNLFTPNDSQESNCKASIRACDNPCRLSSSLDMPYAIIYGITWEFPGGLMARIWHCHCCSLVSVPGLGTEILHQATACHAKKNKITKSLVFVELQCQAHNTLNIKKNMW